MSWKIWKDAKSRAEEEYQKGINERNKGNIDEAIKHFQNAAEIALGSNDPSLKEKGILASVMASMYQVIKQPYVTVFEKLKLSLIELLKLNPNVELDLALPYKIKALDLVREIDILKDIYVLPQINLNEIHKYNNAEAIANNYETVAKELLSYDKENFLVRDLLKLGKPMDIAFKLLALSRIIKALIIVSEEPGKAAELYSEALGYLTQLQDHETMDFAKKKLEETSKATKCWICGRNVQGENVHFIYLQTTMTPFIKRSYRSDAPDIFIEKDSATYIAVCKSCYSAMYNLSDEISKYYYQLAIKALKEVEARLLLEIEQLKREIRSIKISLSR
jgi:tetratricopeptide (TPR) repeat protein